MSYHQKISVMILYALFIVLAVMSSAQYTGAARPVIEQLSHADPAHETLYQKATVVMASILERLPSGPSPGGGGHH